MNQFLIEISVIRIQTFFRKNKAIYDVLELRRTQNVKERMIPILCHRLLDDALLRETVTIANQV